MADERLWTADQVADFLVVPLATLYGWNSRGAAPRRVKVGKHVRYRRADVEAWLDRQYADNGTPAA